MATTEHTINDALAGVLRGTRRAWQQSNVVRSENSGMLKGSNERPDILVIESTVSPVVIETECFGLMMRNVNEPCRLRGIVRVCHDKDRDQGNKL